MRRNNQRAEEALRGVKTQQSAKPFHRKGREGRKEGGNSKVQIPLRLLRLSSLAEG
jgi:hypothetical protein